MLGKHMRYAHATRSADSLFDSKAFPLALPTANGTSSSALADS